jgi:hypothetical protein
LRHVVLALLGKRERLGPGRIEEIPALPDSGFGHMLHLISHPARIARHLPALTAAGLPLPIAVWIPAGHR